MPPEKPFNQLARKIRVGVDYANSVDKEFFFIIIDIAPLDKMGLGKSKEEATIGSSGYNDKWKTAWWFKYYKNGRNNSMKPLTEIVTDIDLSQSKNTVEQISLNMGWLSWADLFKITLKSMI